MTAERRLLPLVPTEPMLVAGFECDAFDKLTTEVVRAKAWPYSCKQAAEFVGQVYTAMVAVVPDDGGMQAAMVKLSRALGHPRLVDAADGQSVDAALIELAAQRIGGEKETPVPSASTPGEWQEAERIRDLPAVDEALLSFKEDCTGDNATCIVRAVMRAMGGTHG